MSDFWSQLSMASPVVQIAVCDHLARNLGQTSDPKLRAAGQRLLDQANLVSVGKRKSIEFGPLRDMIGDAVHQPSVIRFFRRTTTYPSASDFLNSLREPLDQDRRNDSHTALIQSHRTLCGIRSVLTHRDGISYPRRVHMQFEKTALDTSDERGLSNALEIVFGIKIPVRDFLVFFATGVNGFCVDQVSFTRAGNMISIAADINDASGRKVAEYSRFIEMTSEDPQTWRAIGGWISCRQERSGFSRDHLRRYLSFLTLLGVKNFSISALEDGPFVWPYLGFTIAHSRDMEKMKASIIHQIYSRGHRLSPNIVSEILRMEYLWQIFDLEVDGSKVGYEIMKNSVDCPLLRFDLHPSYPGWERLFKKSAFQATRPTEGAITPL